MTQLLRSVPRPLWTQALKPMTQILRPRSKMRSQHLCSLTILQMTLYDHVLPHKISRDHWSGSSNVRQHRQFHWQMILMWECCSVFTVYVYSLLHYNLCLCHTRHVKSPASLADWTIAVAFTTGFHKSLKVLEFLFFIFMACKVLE